MKRVFFVFCFVVNVFFAQQYFPRDFSYLIGIEGFSEELLRMHFKLYENYVKNSNLLFEKIANIDPSAYEFGALKRRLAWEVNGMKLHELYFENLSKKSELSSSSLFSKAVEDQFGSFEKWKKDFISTGMMRGIGWVICFIDPSNQKIFNAWINEHEIGLLAQNCPLLVMDVWEHAYITQFKLEKSQYIQRFFEHIDLEKVDERFKIK